MRMSVWEMRQGIEQAMPWWSPVAVAVAVLLIVWAYHESRRR